jgi:drug/metabolite transporter (DMT)-like permease
LSNYEDGAGEGEKDGSNYQKTSHNGTSVSAFSVMHRQGQVQHFSDRLSRVLPSSGVTSLTQFAPAVYSVIAVFLWGTADFAGGYGSRRANAFVLTAFSHVCAFGLMLAIALTQHGAFPAGASIVWALLAGAVGGFSLAIFYRALALGQMGLTAPIAALLGAAIPTMVDIALEGAPSRWTIGGFGIAILAIWLITRPEPGSSELPSEDGSGRPAGVAMAALAGVGFAGFYLCIHQASGSPSWIACIARVGSFTATAIAVIATRAPLALDRPRAALGMLAGFFDIVASALFIFASQHGRLDEAVVITSLYPAVTVLLARFVLKEHFSLWRFIGLLAALAAVPMIAAG